MSECPVCVTKFTACNRAQCPYCEYTTCRKCACRYAMETLDVKCMSCARAWDRDTQMQLLTKTFVNGRLKCHRADVLLDRERSLLPSTQPAVERERTRRAHQQRIDELRTQDKELSVQLAWIRNQIRKTARLMHEATRGPASSSQATFIQKCPREECRGFLSTAWKCGVCDSYACSHCGELKGATRDAAHTCNADTRAAMELIRRECRACPGCRAMIYRVHGCDQMYCTACFTPFSWRTGRAIVDGPIHNPHFYETRGQGADAATWRNVCAEGVPANALVYRHLVRRDSSPLLRAQVLSIHRFAAHVECVDIPRFPTTRAINDNEDLRVRYLVNELNEVEFKRSLQMREKSREKQRDFGLLLEMFVASMADIFRRFVADQCDAERVRVEAEELRLYTNAQLRVFHARYSCISMQIIISERTGQWIDWVRYSPLARRASATNASSP